MNRLDNVLVIGGGGREHTFVHMLGKSLLVQQLFCAPGNAGTAMSPKCANVGIAATNISELLDFARTQDIGLIVVGPEAPLVAGIVDECHLRLPNTRIVGPNRDAAQLEGSKIAAKLAMDEFGIPTAAWQEFASVEVALRWLNDQTDFNRVVKANGLCGGKGAVVCSTQKEVEAAIRLMPSFGEAGEHFIIEKRLDGLEVSLFLLVDACGLIVPLETAQDYKRIGTGDIGENTGGMGAYSPAPHLPPHLIIEITERLRPMVKKVGFSGFLYVGLMLTEAGWSVLEFNVRMGDPEAQVVLPRLMTDLAEFLYNMAGDNPEPVVLEWDPRAAVTIVAASAGYPGKYEKDFPIFGLNRVSEVAPGAIVFHAGTKLLGDQVVTDGGRVFAVTGFGPTIADAREQACRGIGVTGFTGMTHRPDIAEGVD